MRPGSGCRILRITETDRVQIIPGMPTQVFIKTGHGTVALYALRPLLDSFNDAFTRIEQLPE